MGRWAEEGWELDLREDFCGLGPSCTELYQRCLELIQDYGSYSSPKTSGTFGLATAGTSRCAALIACRCCCAGAPTWCLAPMLCCGYCWCWASNTGVWLLAWSSAVLWSLLVFPSSTGLFSYLSHFYFLMEKQRCKLIKFPVVVVSIVFSSIEGYSTLSLKVGKGQTLRDMGNISFNKWEVGR